MLSFLRWSAAGLLLLAGCAPYFHQPLSTQSARLGAEVRGNSELLRLPVPKEPVVAAVYKFRDQTGQYKPTTNGSSFSTAISQGTTTILMRALEESRWFKAIERENLGNLLNERKIIRSTRAEYTDQTGVKQPPLPPLLFAGIILEGGIVSYDANVLTGGAGLRYFGAGASGQYRQDRVTVYLRAISTSSGQVLKTVYTSKTILSQQVDASLFRFVNFKRLLETETGFTYNEPSEMAVKEAIEKAVQALVLEGIMAGIWEPRNPADRTGPLVQQYLHEKDDNLTYDAVGRSMHPRRAPLGIGLLAGTQRYAGDYRNPLLRPVVDLTLRYDGAAGRRWGAFANVGRGQLAAAQVFRQTYSYIEAGALWRLFPLERFTPLAMAGVGVTNAGLGEGQSVHWYPHGVIGLGAEVLLTDRIGLHLQVDQHLYLSDQVDRMSQGKYNDYFWGGRAGLIFYLGGRKARGGNGSNPSPGSPQSNDQGK
ncbi:CsgG/HfaB family protein [Hymenobacter sp. CRA2]|uniref:CsgG/HfaB family protein n=1 Tax=Hymenobacter sp. CRA2 TaxID=1955620 RepID=UPI00098FF22D|nr:CsgG/HfaB family protein [Hymenobacter sp. CRA2]OON68610.1 curli production assembly/transport component CsgG [Hymenobacter sp. CRA2]